MLIYYARGSTGQTAIDSCAAREDASVPMSSSSVDNDSGAEEDSINGDTPVADGQQENYEGNEPSPHIGGGQIAKLLEEERGSAPTPQPLGNGDNRYKVAEQLDEESDNGSVDALPRRAGSPVDSLLSMQDDTPSIQVIIYLPPSA